MNNHAETLTNLKTLTDLKMITTNGLVLDKPQIKLMILKNVLHCADLANPTKKTKTYSAAICISCALRKPANYEGTDRLRQGVGRWGYHHHQVVPPVVQYIE